MGWCTIRFRTEEESHEISLLRKVERDGIYRGWPMSSGQGISEEKRIILENYSPRIVHLQLYLVACNSGRATPYSGLPSNFGLPLFSPILSPSAWLSLALQKAIPGGIGYFCYSFVEETKVSSHSIVPSLTMYRAGPRAAWGPDVQP